MYYKYHILYKTTCLENGKFYIGIHSTNKLEDGYLGSGKALKRDIARLGKDKFKRKILSFGKSRKELIALEKQYVSDKEVSDLNCYNLIVGGLATNDEVAAYHSSVVSKSNKTRKQTAKFLENLRKVGSRPKPHLKGKKRPPHVIEASRKANLGKVYSEETKRKISESKKGKGKPTGIPMPDHVREALRLANLKRRGLI